MEMVIGIAMVWLWYGCADLFTCWTGEIDRYFELLQDAKIKGYLFEEKNYFNKK